MQWARSGKKEVRSDGAGHLDSVLWWRCRRTNEEETCDRRGGDKESGDGRG